MCINASELSYDFLGTGILNIGLMIFVVHLVFRNHTLEKNIAHGYFHSCAITVGIILCEMITEILQTMGPEVRYGTIVCNLLGFGLSSYLPLVVSWIFDKEHFSIWLWIPIFVFTIILCTTPWNGWIFSVDTHNQYQRGQFYYLYTLTYGWGFLLIQKALIKQAQKVQYKNRTVIYGLMAFLTFGTSIQIIEPKLHTSWTVITFVLVIYYLLLCQMWFEYDILTHISNRSAYEKALSIIEHKKSVSILMIDLDDFKSVNDTYGHQQGDLFLKSMAKILQDHFQNIGNCYRIGGDEFCVICHRIPENELHQILCELDKKVQFAKEQDSRITGMSWGMANYDCYKEKSIMDICRLADQELYKNKVLKKEMEFYS